MVARAKVGGSTVRPLQFLLFLIRPFGQGAQGHLAFRQISFERVHRALTRGGSGDSKNSPASLLRATRRKGFAERPNGRGLLGRMDESDCLRGLGSRPITARL
jgi:hypothetical protein